MSTDSAYAVELKGLTFKRGSRAIFDNIDVRIPRGKVTGIMGPSGCGKTTLLRLIASQLRPSKGGGLGQQAEPAAAFARRPVRHAQAVRRAVPERGAVHRSRRLRERRVSAARAYPAAGRDDPRHRPDEASGRRPARRRGTDAGRAFRRHEAPRRPGPGDRPGPADPALRRAVRGAGSDRHGRPGAPDPPAQRCPRHHQHRGFPRPGRDRQHRRLHLYRRRRPGTLATGRRTSSRKPTILVSASSSRESRMVPFRSIIRPATTGPTCWESADA